VTKKLNNTNPKSFFMDKHRKFQNRDCGTMAKMESNINDVEMAIHWPKRLGRGVIGQNSSSKQASKIVYTNSPAGAKSIFRSC
jgi:hypothetical protein